MKDRILLLIVAVGFSVLNFFTVNALGEYFIPFLNAIVLISLVLDNIRLRKKLKESLPSVK